MEGTNQISTPPANSWHVEAMVAAKRRLAELSAGQPMAALFGDAAIDLLELGKLIVAEVKAEVIASDDKLSALEADLVPLEEARMLHRQAERHQMLVERMLAKPTPDAT